MEIAVSSPADIVIPVAISETGRLSVRVRFCNGEVIRESGLLSLDTSNSPVSTDLFSDRDDQPIRLLFEDSSNSSSCVTVQINDSFEKSLIDEGLALSIGFGTDFARQIGTVILESDRLILSPSTSSRYLPQTTVARVNLHMAFGHHIYTKVSLDGVSDAILTRLGSTPPRYPINEEQRSGLVVPRPPTVHPLDLSFGDFITSLIPIRDFLVLQNIIEMNGGQLIHEGGILFLYSFSNFRQILSSLPNIRYSISNDEEGEEVVAELVFTPEDYIGNLDQGGHRFPFFIDYARDPLTSNTPSLLSLTAPLLQHLGLIFDYHNNQVGFFDPS